MKYHDEELMKAHYSLEDIDVDEHPHVRDGDWLQGAITDIKAQLTRMESKWNVSGNNDPETRANFTDGQPIMLLAINTIGGTAMWKVFVKSIPAEMHRGSGTGNSKKATAVKARRHWLSLQ